METFGSIDNRVELENHSSPVDYLHQRYASTYGNTFNSWNDYLGLSTLVSKAVKGGPLTLQSRAPYLDLELGFCSQDLRGRFAEFSPFSGGSSPPLLGYPAQQHHHHHQQQHHQHQRLDRELGGWNPVDVIMMDSKSQPQVPHSHYPTYQQPPPGAQPRAGRSKPELQVCVFCRNNNESVSLYTTHVLKSPDGRVLCPVLRRYTCPLCGANGDNAHTIKYCPLSKLQPTIPKLKTRNCVSKRVR